MAGRKRKISSGQCESDSHGSIAARGAGQRSRDAHEPAARTDLPSDGHYRCDNQGQSAVAGGGQPIADTHNLGAAAQPSRRGHLGNDAHSVDAPAGDDGGHKDIDPHAADAAIVASLRPWHRRRIFAIDSRIKQDNSLGAFLRREICLRTGVDQPEKDTKEGKALNERARAMIKTGEAIRDQQKKAAEAQKRIAEGKKLRVRDKPKPVEVTDPLFGEYRDIIVASIITREPMDMIQAECEREMEKLAVQHSLWDGWAKDVKGLGAVSFAGMLVDANLISCDKQGERTGGNYPNPSCLWKRMCWAVIDGRRQGDPGPNATKNDWVRHADSRRRRSRGWNIASAIIKAQVRKVLDKNGEDTGEREAKGYLGEIYLNRKAHEAARNEFGDYAELAAEQVRKYEASNKKAVKGKEKKIPKDNLEGRLTPKHLDNRARRYMFKRLLLLMWRARRETIDAVLPTEGVSPATDSGGHAAIGNHSCLAAGGAGQARSETQWPCARAGSSP